MRIANIGALAMLTAMSATAGPIVVVDDPYGPRPQPKPSTPKPPERKRTAHDELRLARAAEKRKRRAARQAKGMATKGEGQP